MRVQGNPRGARHEGRRRDCALAARARLRRAFLCRQGQGREPAALPAGARCRSRQEPVPRPSGIGHHVSDVMKDVAQKTWLKRLGLAAPRREKIWEDATMTALTSRCLMAAVFASGLATSLAFAQDYPSRPVKILVGFGPGGLGDIVTRAVAQKLSVQMGQPFGIENMPGAGGITAAATAARSQPDGHTVLLVSGQNATAPLVFKSLPFNPSSDFRTVSTLTNFDFIIVVDKASPLRSIGDLVV